MSLKEKKGEGKLRRNSGVLGKKTQTSQFATPCCGKSKRVRKRNQFYNVIKI